MSTNNQSHKLNGTQLGSKSTVSTQHHSSTTTSSSTGNHHHQQQATTIQAHQQHHQQQLLTLQQHHQAAPHTVPPRYQPPPQPPGGILKNIPSSKSVGQPSHTNGAAATAFYPAPSSNTGDPSSIPHLKYPPDVPKLATVYIPDALRSAIPSANQPKGSLAQRQLNHRPAAGQPRLAPPSSTGSEDVSANHHQQLQRISAHIPQQSQQPQQHHQAQPNGHSNHQQILLQQQQQHDMLKFVRKSDVDPNVAVSSSVANANGGGIINTGNHSSGSINGTGQPSQTQQHQQQQQQQHQSNNHGSTGSHNNNNNNHTGNNARLSVDQSRHIQQSMLAELRTLKESNQRLSDDNQELRDLCCFLDDDRQKGRKLAREWQRFGRYTASVMRQEVSAYQNKLRQLDDKQQELIRDNLELKELCLYLDEERANVAAHITVCTNCGSSVRPSLRDDGDGSSSSTNADEPMPSVRQFERPIPELNIRPTLSDQTLQYVRSLERKIRQLELQEQANTSAAVGLSGAAADPMSVGRPEAVVRALQILEVREQLERDRSTTGTAVASANGGGTAEMLTANGGGGGVGAGVATEHMDDGEKALVREMCNVVWRKLEDSPNGSGLDPM